jgi:hypothetical protein
MEKILITLGSLLAVILFIGSFWFFPIYNVWTKEMDGKAQLREAEWSKQIAVESAKAKKESATLEAGAEIERAKGVAEANRIVADSLKDNEAYLRYLWIDKLSDNQNVIYVPTEAGLPILEAGIMISFLVLISFSRTSILFFTLK